MDNIDKNYIFDPFIIRPSYMSASETCWTKLKDTSLKVCECCHEFTIYDRECIECQNKTRLIGNS